MQIVSMTVAASALLLSLAHFSAAEFAASDALQHTEHEEHKHDAKAYNFGYGVVSHKHGVDFGQQENSDGHTVTGHYRVKLPDGRTQVVTYTADWHKGYNAHVAYEGHAAHPQGHPQVYQHQESSGLEHGVEGGAYAGAESYSPQESIGQLEHSSSGY